MQDRIIDVAVGIIIVGGFSALLLAGLGLARAAGKVYTWLNPR